jgi:hypothetical protein
MRALATLNAIAVSALVAVFAAGASHAQAPSPQRSAAEHPLKAEKNPPGDIPDNQVFVDYRSPLGFSIKVPEGWARTEAGSGVTFSDKYNTVNVNVGARGAAPTVATAKTQEAAELEKAAKAAQVTGVKAVTLPAGNAILISYGSNSEPNAVTNKAIRQESNRYLLWKDGKLATLTLSAPAGADNADQWLLMAKSFRWR